MNVCSNFHCHWTTFGWDITKKLRGCFFYETRCICISTRGVLSQGEPHDAAVNFSTYQSLHSGIARFLCHSMAFLYRPISAIAQMLKLHTVCYFHCHSNLDPRLAPFRRYCRFLCSWPHPYSTLILGCSCCTRCPCWGQCEQPWNYFRSIPTYEYVITVPKRHIQMTCSITALWERSITW